MVLEVPSPKLKISGDTLELARSVVWGADVLAMLAAPYVDHPELPPTAIKELWRFNDQEINALAVPVAQMLKKLPPKVLKKLEMASPIIGLSSAISAIILPRMQRSAAMLNAAREYNRMKQEELLQNNGRREPPPNVPINFDHEG